jgi:outer membrane protein TolC
VGATSAFKNVIVLGHIVYENGEKMSKSKGNVFDPWTVLNAQGADALRWYLFASSPPEATKRFSQALVEETLRDVFLTLWNTYAFFVLYANLERPDLAAASAAVEAAAADVATARAEERPRLSFAGWLQLSGLRSAGVSTSGGIWSIGPLQLSLPLFDGGSRRAATAAQEAAYSEAVAQLQGSVRRALREVETALVALDSTAARERDVMAAATDFEASLTATAARQRSGLASLLDLEAARRNALLARSAVIELQRERAAAWIALYRSLGGGWTPAEAVPAALNQNPPTPSARP